VEDLELAHRVAVRDDQAVAALIDRFYEPLYRFLWQASGSREDAEDLTAQTLSAAVRDSDRFLGNGSYQAWLFRVAYRQLLQWRRRRIFSFGSSTEPTTDADPSDAVVIVDALRQLAPEQRDAFLLTAVEGFSNEEAGAMLGVPAGTVKSRGFYARQRLRELLEGTFTEVSNHAAI